MVRKKRIFPYLESYLFCKNSCAVYIPACRDNSGSKTYLKGFLINSKNYLVQEKFSEIEKNSFIPCKNSCQNVRGYSKSIGFSKLIVIKSTFC